MTTTLNLNGDDVEIAVLEGKDVGDDEAVLQIVRGNIVITADQHGYSIERHAKVFDLDVSYAPLTNLQRALLVAPGHAAANAAQYDQPKRGPLFNLLPEG